MVVDVTKQKVIKQTEFSKVSPNWLMMWEQIPIVDVCEFIPMAEIVCEQHFFFCLTQVVAR